MNLSEHCCGQSYIYGTSLSWFKPWIKMKNFNNSNDEAYIHGVDFTAELEKNEFN